MNSPVRDVKYHNLQFSNRLLPGALGVVLFLMLIVLEIPRPHDFFHFAPLSAGQWLWVIALSLAPLPIVEAVKGVLRGRRESA